MAHGQRQTRRVRYLYYEPIFVNSEISVSSNPKSCIDSYSLALKARLQREYLQFGNEICYFLVRSDDSGAELQGCEIAIESKAGLHTTISLNNIQSPLAFGTVPSTFLEPAKFASLIWFVLGNLPARITQGNFGVGSDRRKYEGEGGGGSSTQIHWAPLERVLTMTAWRYNLPSPPSYFRR